MKKHKLKAIDYFKRHHSKECFITSDGRVFHNSGAARSFATSLKDDSIEYYTRAEVEQEQKQKETPKIIEEKKSEIENQNDDNANDTSLSTIQRGVNENETLKIEDENDEKAKRTAELLALELTSKHYNEMMSLVAFFGLETKDKKTESLIEALTEYKSKLEA